MCAVRVAGSSLAVCGLLCHGSHPAIESAVAMLRRHVALTTNQSSKQPASVCNKVRDSLPGYCRATIRRGLTKKRASIWLFMAQRRCRDAGLPPLTTLTTCTWGCLCVCVTCTRVMRACRDTACVQINTHVRQERGGEIFLMR